MNIFRDTSIIETVIVKHLEYNGFYCEKTFGEKTFEELFTVFDYGGFHFTYTGIIRIRHPKRKVWVHNFITVEQAIRFLNVCLDRGNAQQK